MNFPMISLLGTKMRDAKTGKALFKRHFFVAIAEQGKDKDSL